VLLLMMMIAAAGFLQTSVCVCNRNYDTADGAGKAQV
jgi:hypothetical protein